MSGSSTPLDRVVSIIQASEKHQLLNVVGSAEDKVHIVHVVKVINRIVMSDTVMRAQMNWLYSGRNLDGYVDISCYP